MQKRIAVLGAILATLILPAGALAHGQWLTFHRAISSVHRTLAPDHSRIAVHRCHRRSATIISCHVAEANAPSFVQFDGHAVRVGMMFYYVKLTLRAGGHVGYDGVITWAP